MEHRIFPYILVFAGLGGLWALYSHDLSSAIVAGLVVVPLGALVIHHLGHRPKVG